MIWKIKDRPLDLTSHAFIMGILNTTPDSFSDGGKFHDLETALAHAREMIAEGATIIDIGGESTRPGAISVCAAEEISRTIPVIEALRSEWDGYISIDTQKAAVAAAALDVGADIVNDVSGLTADPDMPGVCAKAQCGIVIMHMRGTPADMQDAPVYADVVGEISSFFQERLRALTELGITADRICFDPGIGFGKTLDQNLALLRSLDSLAPKHRPLLLGVSRKSFISKISDASSPSDRDSATIAITAFARGKNIMLHRVHNVRGNLAALHMVEAMGK